MINTAPHTFRILKWLLFSAAFVGLWLIGARATKAEFPDKPIKIIVYTGPGGLIDTTARKFTEIAEKYVTATFVVENKPGAGGIIAMEKVLQLPADGYTLCACTKSNIAKLVSTKRENYIDELDWLAMLMADPECIITRTQDPRSNWSVLVEDAHNHPGEQRWVGPTFGGLDHVMALQTWQKFDIQARWIPFDSGGEAKAALLGNQGVAYVGNPRDAAGNPDLHISVISSPQRLKQYPNTPVFSEFGVTGLDEEFMWRGFSIKQGCPPEILKWYDELFQKVNQDEEWREFWMKDGIEVVYYDSKEFTPIVHNDRKEFAHYLGILQTSSSEDKPSQQESREWMLLALIVSANIALAAGLVMRGQRDRVGFFLIPSTTLSLAFLFFAISYEFPQTDGVGAAAVPRLWAVMIVPFALLLTLQTVRAEDRLTGKERTDLVWKFGALLLAYILSIVYTGYFLGSFLFLLAAMFMLGMQKPKVAIAVTTAWLVFAYIAFAKIMFVPFPVGRFFE